MSDLKLVGEKAYMDQKGRDGKPENFVAVLPLIRIYPCIYKLQLIMTVKGSGIYYSWQSSCPNVTILGQSEGGKEMSQQLLEGLACVINVKSHCFNMSVYNLLCY